MIGFNKGDDGEDELYGILVTTLKEVETDLNSVENKLFNVLENVESIKMDLSTLSSDELKHYRDLDRVISLFIKDNKRITKILSKTNIKFNKFTGDFEWDNK